MKRAIVTDDSRVTRQAIKLLLEKKRISVVEAQNGQELLNKYDEVLPDYVTLDLDMPGISGIQTLRALKNRHPEAKVIIVSGENKKDVVLDALKSGASNFLLKPISYEKLSRVI